MGVGGDNPSVTFNRVAARRLNEKLSLFHVVCGSHKLERRSTVKKGQNGPLISTRKHCQHIFKFW